MSSAPKTPSSCIPASAGKVPCTLVVTMRRGSKRVDQMCYDLNIKMPYELLKLVMSDEYQYDGMIVVRLCMRSKPAVGLSLPDQRELTTGFERKVVPRLSSNSSKYPMSSLWASNGHTRGLDLEKRKASCTAVGNGTNESLVWGSYTLHR